MSSIPSTFPIADTSGTGVLRVIIDDVGSFFQRDNDTGADTGAVLTVRVENLPDTANAYEMACDAALAAYPTHPSESCLVALKAGPPAEGEQIILRMGTTDPGTTAKTVTLPSTVGTGTTGTTGTIARVAITFGYPGYVSDI